MFNSNSNSIKFDDLKYRRMECVIELVHHSFAVSRHTLTNTFIHSFQARERKMCIVDLGDELDNRLLASKRERERREEKRKEKYDDRLAIAARFVQRFFSFPLSLVETDEAREKNGGSMCQ
jgi:hypothetical protein